MDLGASRAVAAVSIAAGKAPVQPAETAASRRCSSRRASSAEQSVKYPPGAAEHTRKMPECTRSASAELHASAGAGGSK